MHLSYKALSVFIFYDHVIGHPVLSIKYPDCYFAVVESSLAVGLYQFPLKSVSAYTSNDFLLFGSSINLPSLITWR